MNIEKANAIPLIQILETLGFQPMKKGRREYSYLSPLRAEKTASFFVNHEKNLWYDHGTGEGGDCVTFVCKWLDSHREAATYSDALRWLANMTDITVARAPIVAQDETRADPTLILKQTKPLNHPALIKYLQGRGVSLSVAKTFMVEAILTNLETHKNFFAIAVANEEGGHEIRNQFFKGCVHKKAPTFIRGKKPKPSGIHIFEGMMDYASSVEFNRVTAFDDDVIILNSLSCLKQATPYIKGYGYHIAYTWLDNDTSGKRGTKFLDEFFQTQNGLTHKPMNSLYAKHCDVNEWHMHHLGLSL